LPNEAIIALVKTLHTAVFVLASGCIVYVLVSGAVGRTHRLLLYAAFLIPVAIGAAWFINGRECLLSSVIYRLSDGDHAVADIYLPDAVARRIMPVSTALLALGGGMAVWRTITRRWRPR